MSGLPSFKMLVDAFSVPDMLSDHANYLAHTPDEHLSDHMTLVSHYFLAIIQYHRLEPILNGLFLKIARGKTDSATVVKKLFWNAVLYHDTGKVNENFQRVKMENKLFPSKSANGIETQHSILSAFLFLIHEYSNEEFKRIADTDKKLYSLVAFFAHNIIKHHSVHLDDLSERKTFQKFTQLLCTKLGNYLRLFNVQTDPHLVSLLPRLSELLEFNLPFDWFLLIRLHFSLLTAADYYATSHYCGKWKVPYQEFGTLTAEQNFRHFGNLRTSQEHNKSLYEQTNAIHNFALNDLATKGPENLNRLRSKMAAEVLQNTRKYSSERLFYIEAPTGGGKTNMAFIVTQELLNANRELNKVFYVFPFTTLITQTKKSAQETLGLLPEEFVELHSKAPLKEKEESEAEQDGLYGEKRLDNIHNLFVNYPYTFLSHVRFFDILKGNEKSSIYLLHRLANSVVVIDEVQAYNPFLWDKIAYLLKEHAEVLNIRFVIMSATLPKIGDLAETSFRHLLPDAIPRFFSNPNFAERVHFNDDLTKLEPPDRQGRENYLEVLANQIHDKAESYRKENGAVRLIAEFIFKKSATEFAEVAKDIFPDYQILVLSGTILEPRRKEIISYIKNPDFSSHNILLVTTQVVEAGVDIDMDIGFKNRSIIDSEEQLAGRVNRNIRKKNCVVYLFNLDDASVIYGKDQRYKEWKKGLEEDYLTILQTKRFDIVYDRVKQYLKDTNKQKNTGGTLTSYKSKLSLLNFPDVDHDFQLIDQKSTSVFVPINLPVYAVNETGDRECIFTENQIIFLRKREIFIEDDHLSGMSIFSLYKEMITNHEQGFSDRKWNIESMQSIMSMFTFSLFSESRLVKELVKGGNPEEYGYLYLTRHDEVYDYNLGLLDKHFDSLIFL